MDTPSSAHICNPGASRLPPRNAWIPTTRILIHPATVRGSVRFWPFRVPVIVVGERIMTPQDIPEKPCRDLIRPLMGFIEQRLSIYGTVPGRLPEMSSRWAPRRITHALNLGATRSRSPVVFQSTSVYVPPIPPSSAIERARALSSSLDFRVPYKNDR